tara:strand:- start:32 stop:208 length:177 start_codon:yes stop_codon:yes gene_type:complete
VVLVSSVDNVPVHVHSTVFLYVPSEAAEVEDEESVKAIYIVVFFLVIVQTVYSYNNIS